MSVTVQHLNADSSFLLTFSSLPPQGDSSAADVFSILIDPWLAGPSVVTAPWFAKTVRRIPSAINNLSDIVEPDVVLVSQNKPDHCHKQTLLQLRPDAKTIIAAEPGAAKTIKSWNHFKPDRIKGLAKYGSKASGRSLHMPIPAPSSDGFPGEVVISFIPAKQYMTGLHNAIGITYQAPTWTRNIAPVATIDLPRATKYFHVPLSPRTLPPASPQPLFSPLLNRAMSFDLGERGSDTPSVPPPWRKGHRPQLSRSSNTASSEFLPMFDHPAIQLGPNTSADTLVEKVLTVPAVSPQLPKFDFGVGASPFMFINSPFTPPASPLEPALMSPLEPHPSSPTLTSPTSTHFHHRRSSSIPSHQKSLSSIASMPNLIAPVTPARPKVISVIYSPHGLPLSDLQPYIQKHLVSLGALPLTLLLHSFDHVQNPWYLGGNIMTGMSGGAEIARTLMARYWISAHDEDKDDRGLSVKKLRVRRTPVSEVRKHLGNGDPPTKKCWYCDVRQLDAGDELTIHPAGDQRSSKLAAPG